MAFDQQSEGLHGVGMLTKAVELKSMSLDDLWSLQEEISAILAARIQAEQQELEKRLALLNRGLDLTGAASDSFIRQNGKPRRKYPRVLPKYRNPQTSKSWSGRGKRPRWLVAAMKSGRKLEEFRIGDSDGSKGKQQA